MCRYLVSPGIKQIQFKEKKLNFALTKIMISTVLHYNLAAEWI